MKNRIIVTEDLLKECGLSPSTSSDWNIVGESGLRGWRHSAVQRGTSMKVAGSI